MATNGSAFPPIVEFPEKYDRIAVVAKENLGVNGPIPAQGVILMKGQPPPEDTSFVIDITLQKVKYPNQGSDCFFILPWINGQRECQFYSGSPGEVGERFEECVSNIISRAPQEVQRVAVMVSEKQVLHLRLLQGQKLPLYIIGQREIKQWGETQ